MSWRAAVTPRRVLAALAALLALILLVALYALRDDILRASIDPKVPYQTYTPPPMADYASRSGWAMAPPDMARAAAGEPAVDVFFVHPTTYDGAGEWNAPLNEGRSQHMIQAVMLPNYAGPFAGAGRIFAPQYRQATLFSLMTFKDDAQDARRLAYEDVRAAFQAYLEHFNNGRPFVIVGVGEGGLNAGRLLERVVDKAPTIRARLVAAYLIDTAVPAKVFGSDSGLHPCQSREQAGCVVAWAQFTGSGAPGRQKRLERAAWWSDLGELKSTKGEAQVCVNPLLGAATGQLAPRKLNLGAANATDLEWGARPALIAREVSAQCVDGVLQVSPPSAGSLKPSGSWTDRKKEPDFNLFYADLEADVQARVKTYLAKATPPKP